MFSLFSEDSENSEDLEDPEDPTTPTTELSIEETLDHLPNNEETVIPVEDNEKNKAKCNFID